MNPSKLFLAVALFAWAACSCSAERESASPDSGAGAGATTVADDRAVESGTQPSGPIYAHDASLKDWPVFEPWQGDLPEMIDRRMIRALVPWSDSYYFLDGPEQQGIAFEALKVFEKWLNEQLGSGTVRMHVVILPVRRDQMLHFIAEGRGDLAMGGVTITEQRQELVDFTDPTSKEVQEWLVEAPSSERVDGIDDLSGREVHVRASSSYWESLEKLNADFRQRGLPPAVLVAADEYLSTEDLMQMANADAIPYTVADHPIAQYWAEALVNIRVRDDIVLRRGAHFGLALRKDSPEFKALLNRFVEKNRQGTLTGNVIMNRYLKDTTRLHAITGEAEQQRMQAVWDHFRDVAPEYQFDALMMLAQGFQESRLDQSRRSPRGAIGIMQLLPSTAADEAVGVEDITSAENNILAGVRYMAWIRDTYFDDPALDDRNKTALAFASYNAGPNRVRSLRDKADQRGLDPNVWFDNVEIVASEEIGRETVDYVANIYKYYLAFKLAREKAAQG